MAEQPMPTAGRVNVTPVARAAFLEMLRDREIKGMVTYGTTLQTNNGRDAIRDAMEEAVDLWQYLTQILLETEELAAENAALKDELIRLKTELIRWQRGAS